MNGEKEKSDALHKTRGHLMEFKKALSLYMDKDITLQLIFQQPTELSVVGH